jgi:hypothetical protein
VTAFSELPAFTNDAARCAACGATTRIRVHFCRCDRFGARDHYHRICTRCAHEWIERAPGEEEQPPTRHPQRNETSWPK